jgi:hypothetical protein
MSMSDAVQSPAGLSEPSVGRLPVWLGVLLLLLCVGAGYFGEKTVFDYREFYYEDEPGFPPHPPEYIQRQRWNMIRNFSIGFGTFGALLIGSIGLAAGLTASPGRAATGMLLGAVAGLVVGAVGGSIAYLISQMLLTSLMETMLKGLLTFGPLWLALGLIAAIVCNGAGGRSSFGKAVVAGLATGLIAAVAIQLLLAVAFPSSRPELMVPDDRGSRLANFVSGATILGLGGLFLLTRRANRE